MMSTLRVLNYGGGSQSSALLMMALRGEIPSREHPDEPERLDHVIFADTQSEPKAVYDYVALMEAECAKAGVRFHTVTAGNLYEDVLGYLEGRATRMSSPPFLMRNPDGTSAGPMHRNCSVDYKIKPIESAIRSVLGLRKGQRWPDDVIIEQWFGMSLEEIGRMKIPQRKTFRFRYPLIEDVPMRRDGSIIYLRNLGFPDPPRSACYFCPFHSNEEWRNIRDTDPEGWEKSLALDSVLDRAGVPFIRAAPFMHRDLVRLAEADIEEPDDNDLFQNECFGVCGT